MGSAKLENKHAVGILVNKKCRQRINKTDYVGERAIATSVTVDKQHVLFRDMRTSTLKRCTDQSRNSRIPKKNPNCGRRLQCRIGIRVWS